MRQDTLAFRELIPLKAFVRYYCWRKRLYLLNREALPEVRNFKEQLMNFVSELAEHSTFSYNRPVHTQLAGSAEAIFLKRKKDNIQLQVAWSYRDNSYRFLKRKGWQRKNLPSSGDSIRALVRPPRWARFRSMDKDEFFFYWDTSRETRMSFSCSLIRATLSLFYIAHTNTHDPMSGTQTKKP